MSKSKDAKAIRERKKMRKKEKHAVCAVCGRQNHVGDLAKYEGVFVCPGHPLPNVMAAMRK